MTSGLGANESVPQAARTLRAAASSLAILLLPKCPLCVAAYLTGLGISAGAAHSAAPFVRPLAYLLAAVSWLALVTALWHTRKRAAQPSPATATGSCRDCCGIDT